MVVGDARAHGLALGRVCETSVPHDKDHEPSTRLRGSQRAAASVIFNLPKDHVVDAAEGPLGGRRVIVRADDVADGCPETGVISARVQDR